MRNNKDLKIFICISILIHLMFIFIKYNNDYRYKSYQSFIEIDLIGVGESEYEMVTDKGLNKKAAYGEPRRWRDENYSPEVTTLDQNKSDNTENTSDSVEISSCDKNSTLNFSYFIQMVRDKIEKTKNYPDIAQQNNWSGEVHLRFLIASTGEVRKIFLVKSSGFDILDKSAILTIQKASPFRPLPEGLYDNEILVSLPIIFELQ